MNGTKELRCKITTIPGLLVFNLPIHADGRGWFKENYQQEKMSAIGLPENFTIVQNNISYNATKGVTRGIHAEPWDKYISVASGSVFAAIVDFRKGPTFGNIETITITPDVSIFVPKGCGNSFQTLENDTVYTYLVNDHWTSESKYTLVNLADSDLAISWPIPLDKAIISDKDKSHLPLKDITPLEF